MAPWRDDFTRYRVPGLCLAAGQLKFQMIERSLTTQASFDYLADSQERDTLSALGVVPFVRTCGAHFTIANTAVRELGVLFSLAVLEQNDSLAQAVLAQRVQQAATAEERVSLWKDAAREYLGSEPIHLTAAVKLMGELDTQGQPAAKAFLLNTLKGIVWSDKGRFGQASEWEARRYAEQIITFEHAGDISHADQDIVKNAYAALLWMAMVKHPDSVAKVAQHAKDDLGQHDTLWRILSVPAVLDSLGVTQLTKDFQPTGNPIPPITADFWFPVSNGDTVRPVRGKVNLICNGGWPTLWSGQANDQQRMFWFGGDKNGGYEFAARVRRWLTKYSAAGLVITIVHQGKGYLDVNPSVRRVFSSPAEEAHYWQWYYQEFEHLPVTVAVLSDSGQQYLPPPDGRRVGSGYVGTRPDSMYVNRYVDWRKTFFTTGTDCTIIGRDGRAISNEPDQLWKKNDRLGYELQLEMLMRPPAVP